MSTNNQNISYFDQYDENLTIDLTQCLLNYSNQNNYTYQLSNIQPVITTIPNLFSQVDLISNYLQNNMTEFTPYQMFEGQRVEMVSYDLYGVVDFWWTIVMINQVNDIIHQFPTTETIIKDIATQYSLNENLYPLETYYNFLENQNENSRNIVVLQSMYITQFVNQFIEVIQQQSGNTP